MSESKILLRTSGGEVVYREGDSIVVELPEGRRTLSTSWKNGGVREGLRSLVNHKMTSKGVGEDETEGGDILGYIDSLAGKLGLDAGSTSILLTAADMRHMAVRSLHYRGVEITALVTGGIEVNGGRAGDPASYHQENGQFEKVGGTINTILIIGASLPDYAMCRAMMTAVEAKVAALQQLMVPSCYSSGIATGSGTDMFALVCDSAHPIELTDAGKHSKLGEMIGRTVMEATTEALARQSELTPLSQRDALVRLSRHGIDETRIWERATHMEGENRRGRFMDSIRTMAKDPEVVGLTASVLHLQDEVMWGLLPEPAATRVAMEILSPRGVLDPREGILENLVRALAWRAKNDGVARGGPE